MTILDPKKVLEIADHIIRNTHPFAADASADPAINAVVVALCGTLNQILAPLFVEPTTDQTT